MRKERGDSMNEITTVEHLKPFDYSQLDEQTAIFLRQKELNMRNIVGNAYTELGRELKEAQEALSNHRNGIFEEWYTSLGFKKRTVYNLIQRYELIVQNLHNKDLIEELPASLTYEISKPSANEELKQKVLAGEIKTLKEYREKLKQLEAELEQEKQRAKQANEEKEEAEQRAMLAERRLKEMAAQAPKVREIVKEVVPPEIKRKLEEAQRRVAELERQLKEQENDIKKVEKIREEIERLSLERDDIRRQIQSATELSGLYVEIEHLLKTKLAPIKYSRALTERRDSDVVMENLRGIIEMVEQWCYEMKSYLPKGKYIDAEVVEL